MFPSIKPGQSWSMLVPSIRSKACTTFCVISVVTVLCTDHNFLVVDDRVNPGPFTPPGEVTFLPQWLTVGMLIHFGKIHSRVYRPQYPHPYLDQNSHVISYEYSFAKSCLFILEHTGHGPSMKESWLSSMQYLQAQLSPMPPTVSRGNSGFMSSVSWDFLLGIHPRDEPKTDIHQ